MKRVQRPRAINDQVDMVEKEAVVTVAVLAAGNVAVDMVADLAAAGNVVILAGAVVTDLAEDVVTANYSSAKPKITKNK
jgi:hypothetical protein